MNNVFMDSINYKEFDNTSIKNNTTDKKESKFNDILKNSCDKSYENKVDKESNVSRGKNAEIDTEQSKKNLSEKDNIKKTLENAPFEKLTENNKEEKDVDSDLLSILSNLLNNKIDLKEFNKQIDKLNLPDKLSKNIKDVAFNLLEGDKNKSNVVNKLMAIVDNLEKFEGYEKIRLGIKNQISGYLSNTNNDTTKEDFTKKAIRKLHDKVISNLENHNSEDKNENSKDKKIQGINKNTLMSDENKKETKSLDNTNTKEDKFLSELTKGEKDSKTKLIDKATNFMTQFDKISDNKEKTLNTSLLKINKNTFNSDVVKSLKYMTSNNMKELTVKIVPKELGEVVIKLIMEGNMMKAKITATNKQSYNILNSNINDINNALTNQNIKIQNVEINIYQGDTTFFSSEFSDSNNGGSQKENNSNSMNKTTAVNENSEDEKETKLFYENNINALA